MLKQVRGVHYNSRVFFSSRLLVLPFVEVRVAKQEDHDDLAAVFNSQSETVTEIYGDYFLAELIAAQDHENKALVAQVKDKAIGLLGLTSDLDVKFLHECFDLEQHDNLFKPEFMDAVNKRREHLRSEQQKQEEKRREQELRMLKEETMKCNIIAQRISFQEFLMTKAEEIKETIEKMKSNEEEIKKLKRSDVEDLFDEWFAEFEVPQPSEYFFNNPTDDSELCTNIQTKNEFALSCLEIFGLPPRYMEGNGHFPDWGKEKDQKAGTNLLRGMQKKKQNKNKNLKKKFKNLKKADDKEEKVKPTHFDLDPFLKAFQDFVALNSDVRSQIRIEMKKESDVIDSIFVDQYGEKSFKQCVDIMSLEKILANRQIELHKLPNGTVGKLLRCFGQIEYQLKEVIRMPEKDPKEIQRELNKKRAEEEAKLKEEQEGKGKEKKPRAISIDEDSDEIKKRAPPQPINVKLYETSIHDMYEAIRKMQDYDFTLSELEIVTGSLDTERAIEGLQPRDEAGSELNVTGDEMDNYISKPTPPSRQGEEIKYSDDPEYDEVVKTIQDLETLPSPPEKAKNAFAITLFCIEVAFDSRSRDFLKYAFDLYPDRDYLILTQPHTVPESTLLQKFTLVDRKPNNTFNHVLYIIHRDSLLDTEIVVRRAVTDDIEDINSLTDVLDNSKVINEDIYNSLVNPESKYQTYVAKIANTVTGVFVLSKGVNLNYYKSHFHIQDSILLPEHDARGHTRMLHSVINPIFERNTRYFLKEILRLSGKTCLYFEIASRTVIPQIFNELISVRTRRFPHFLKRKWDHERNIYPNEEEENRDDMDGAERDYLDEEEAPFALCFATRRLLSEPKIVKNSRIVVIGSSDTGISFIEALLSISYLRFTNIILISPGGLPHHHYEDQRDNLKAYSTSYTNEELKRLMLENRVQVINARMIDIERQEKKVILHDGSMVPYDTLILTMGLQDQTLNTLGYSSKGISPTPEGKEVVEGLLSIDDPFLYKHLEKGGELVRLLSNRKKKNDVVVYGRTLNAYCCIQGLIRRGVRPQNIYLIIPDADCHLDANYDEIDEMESDIPFINPEAFKDGTIRQKIHDNLIAMGITIFEHCLLKSVEKDDEN